MTSRPRKLRGYTTIPHHKRIKQVPKYRIKCRVQFMQATRTMGCRDTSSHTCDGVIQATHRTAIAWATNLRPIDEREPGTTNYHSHNGLMRRSRHHVSKRIQWSKMNIRSSVKASKTQNSHATDGLVMCHITIG